MLVLGMISGTSVDGIDAALVEISGQPPALQLELRHAISLPHDANLREHILRACDREESRTPEICILDFAIGEAFARVAQQLMEEVGIAAADISLIGSHGQTIWHEIGAAGEVLGTLQIGAAAVIAERTGITTIGNLRARDVAAGGQGAPFAAIFDWLMLRLPEDWRALVNIGGIGNITFLPPLSNDENPPLALDTGPGCGVMDSVVSMITHGAQTYDDGGRIAARGIVDAGWLNELLTLPYFAQKPPKTTGRELFSRTLATQWLHDGRARGLSDADILASITALTAASIADSIQRFAPAPPSELIVAGGGAENSTMMAMLRERLPQLPVRHHDELGIRAEFKEAMFFALLAYESWHGRAAWHPALTGARHASILGDITPGANFAALIRETWCGVGG